MAVTTLILGGARSGKTRYALDQAQAAVGEGGLVMIATAQARDDEMAERIARHQAERDVRWRTVEAAFDLFGVIGALQPGETAVVDCLTLWLSNLMEQDADLPLAFAALIDATRVCPARLYLVSNEVGLGIVPDNALARRFRDEAGRLHQALAQAADRVVFVAAGLPMTLKG